MQKKIRDDVADALMRWLVLIGTEPCHVTDAEDKGISHDEGSLLCGARIIEKESDKRLIYHITPLGFEVIKELQNETKTL